jgi:hypothetical protein
MVGLIVQFIVSVWAIGFMIAAVMLVVGVPYVLIRLACGAGAPGTKSQSRLVYHSKIPGHARNSRPPKDQQARHA